MTTFMTMIAAHLCPETDLGWCNFPAWGVDRRLACAEADDPGAESCGIGCGGCSDGVGGIADAQFLESKRWLRNHPNRPSRTAYGDFEDLEQIHVRSHAFGGGMSHVVLLPLGAKFQAAPCHRQTGHECFDMDLCDCYGDSCITPRGFPSRCVHGEAIFEPVIGNRMTCYVSTGAKWRPERFCAGVDGFPIDWGVAPTQPQGDQLLNVHIVLLDSDCAANMLINCTGKTLRSSCCQNDVGQGVSGRCCRELEGQGTDPCPEGSTYNFFFATGSVSRFGFIFVTYPVGNEPKLVIPEGATDGLRAVIDAKNKALHQIVTRMFAVGPQINQRIRFDQLDNQTATFSGRLGNDALGLYRRTWRKPDGLTCAQMLALNTTHPLITDSPLVMDMPNSFLKHSRCPVSAKLYLIDINYRAHFVVVPIRQDSGDRKHMFLASVRVHIEGQFATSAVLADPACKMERPWLSAPDDSLTLAIDDSDACEGILRYVRGTAADGSDRGIVDEIIYVDEEGRRFDPPERVHWWGNRGQTSQPRWHVTPPMERELAGGDLCKLMRDQVNEFNPDHPDGPLAVGGWPYSADTAPDDPNTVYEGMAKFRFQR